MRSRYHTSGPSWKVRTNSDPLPAVRVTIHEPEMPRGQMIALLRVRARTAGDHSLFDKVLTMLMAVGSDEPTTFDLTTLREEGYIRWSEQLRDDQILPRGLAKAGDLVRTFVAVYNVHHFTFHAATPSSGPRVTCCCGWSALTTIRNADARHRRAAAHEQDVAEGRWPPQESQALKDFLNEVAPARLDFNSPVDACGPETNPGTVAQSCGTAAVPGTFGAMTTE